MLVPALASWDLFQVGSHILLACLHPFVFWELPYFLAPQDATGWSCMFSAQSLQSAILPRSLPSFYWTMRIRNQSLNTGCSCCCWPISTEWGTKGKGNTCKSHTQMYSRCFCIHQLSVSWAAYNLSRPQDSLQPSFLVCTFPLLRYKQRSINLLSQHTCEAILELQPSRKHVYQLQLEYARSVIFSLIISSKSTTFQSYVYQVLFS